MRPPVRNIILPVTLPVISSVDVVSGPASRLLWTPLSLGAKLKAWWHADDVALGAVTSWIDRVAALTVTGTGPIAAATGGFRYVTFDGTDDYLRGSTATLGLPTGATVGEMWALVSDDTSSGQRIVMQYGGASAGGTSTRSIRHVPTPPAQLQVQSSSTTPHTDTGHTLAGLAVVSGYFGTTVNGGRINGEATVPATTAHGGTMNTSTTSTTIGASNAGTATLFWQGKLRHVMATLELTLAEQNKLEAWLAWDVNRADLLPSGHPYRNGRP